MRTAAGSAQPLLSVDEIQQLLAAAARWSGLGPIDRTGQRGRVGEHSARTLGSGMDYAETRRYQPGDQPRHINWRASARQQHTQVRVFHQDINPQACILLDRRATMCFGTRGRLKLAQALRAALFIAAHETGQGHELAILDMAHRPHWLPARPGRAALQQLLQGTNQVCRVDSDTTDVGDFATALPILQRHLPAGSRLYLLSDFDGLTEGQRRDLLHLGRDRRMHAIGLFDAAERQLPALGPLALSWGRQQRLIDSDDPAQRALLAQRFAQRWQQLRDWFESAGGSFHPLASHDDDLAQALAGQADGRV